MKGYVDGIDWVNASAMLYWSIPSSYSQEKGRTEIKNAIFSGEYWGSMKVDGYYQRLIKDEDGNCFMIARSKNVKGEAVDKYEWVPQLHSFMESLPNGTVLLSECYLPNNEGSKNITSLLGCLKDKCIARQEKGQKLHFYIFDICAWDGVNLVKSYAIDRFAFLNLYSLQYKHEYVEWAKYYNGKELWNKLQEYLISGKEGIVITKNTCPIYFKRTPAHMTIKVKKELQQTIDCFFTGRASAPTRLYSGKEIENWKYWEDIRTGEKKEGNYFKEYFENKTIEPVTKPYFYSWYSSLEIGVLREGKIFPIGFLSGITDEMKADPKKYKMQPIEVTAMEILDTGGLRHAKMLRFRSDLTIEDCTWEKIYE